MSIVRISELNQLNTWTSDDFFPIVDSGSLTTYRTPLSSMLTYVAQSGSVTSASWASSSISSSWARTSSLAMSFEHVKTIGKQVYTESLYTNAFCKLTNDASTIPGQQNLLISLKGWGDICTTSKIYLFTADLYSPGMIIDPVTSVPLDGTAYNGYYEVKSLSSTRNYSPSVYNTDLNLEVSQSRGGPSINELYFRVRCDSEGVQTPAQSISASLTFWFLDDLGQFNDAYGKFNFIPLPDNKVLSSKNLPSWPNSFVNIKNYKMTISGSVAVEKEITASWVPVGFVGTASWALNVPGGNMVITGGSYDISSSWASSSLSSSISISSSYAETASFLYSASYAKSSSVSEKSITASYIDPSALLGSIPGLPKAWAVCACTASHPDSDLYYNIPGKNWNNYAILSGYNVLSVKRAINNSGQGVKPPWDASQYGATGQDFLGRSSNMHWIVTLSTPLPSLNYTVIGGAGAEQGSAEWNILTMFPFAARTTSQFTMSITQGSTDWEDSIERNWFSFMVLSNP